MFKALCFCLLLFSRCSYHQNVEKQESALISWTGSLSKNSNLKLIEEFKLDSIQFTDREYKYLLQGAIIIGKERQTYSLMLKNHPLDIEKNEVIDWNFPLEKLDSTAYNCFFRQTEGGYYVKWINSKSELRIFIKEKFISER